VTVSNNPTSIGNTVKQARRPRVFAAIASFGLKNIDFLKRVLRTYKRMRLEVDVVVLSDAPKQIGAGVRVEVGLPSSNPWSLPFAHKPLFAQNVDEYDLFIYSEDDIEVTEENIDAFLRWTPRLPDDEIAGFLRYEVDASGARSLPDVHGRFHWVPESVRRRGTGVFAEFTNEHAAFYILTRQQLKRAIASGGFMRDPSKGKYDMLCSAATDPYTNCGFRKVLCVSEIDKFLIHHLPNRYAGRVGLPLTAFQAQIQALNDIASLNHPATRLCAVESAVLQGRWSKSFYEAPSADIMDLVAEETETLLSVGCGCGATEAALKKRGIAVTALPLDSVIGASAAQVGIELIDASFEDSIHQLKGRSFDAILIIDLLHLQPNPFAMLDQCAQLLRPGGSLIVAGPNFEYLPLWILRMCGSRGYRDLRSFSIGGVYPLSIGQIRRGLRRAGCDFDQLKWQSRHNQVSLSGAVASRRGMSTWLEHLWRSLRKAALEINAGRVFAINWSARARKLS
jgi:2-polyprenyl-3-methyl-5-hydroxy-6-metoxy-1,4-benzoquinol methylase